MRIAVLGLARAGCNRAHVRVTPVDQPRVAAVAVKAVNVGHVRP
jgi:hypothetical protein